MKLSKELEKSRSCKTVKKKVTGSTKVVSNMEQRSCDTVSRLKVVQ
jgi:hypothetical protein